jgi:hypothetical protein
VKLVALPTRKRPSGYYGPLFRLARYSGTGQTFSPAGSEIRSLQALLPLARPQYYIELCNFFRRERNARRVFRSRAIFVPGDIRHSIQQKVRRCRDVQGLRVFGSCRPPVLEYFNFLSYADQRPLTRFQLPKTARNRWRTIEVSKNRKPVMRNRVCKV